MSFKHQKQAVIVFSEKKNAQCAIAQLQASGFPMDQVAVTGADLRLTHQHTHEQPKSQHARKPGTYQLVIQGSEEQIRQVRSALLGRCQIAQYSACDFQPEDTTAPLKSPPRPTVHSENTQPKLSQAQWAVGFFPQASQIKAAIAELKSIGFPLAQLRVIAQNLPPEILPDVKVSPDFKHYQSNFPLQRVSQWRNRVQRGDILLMLRGTSQKLATAAAILNHQGVQDFSLYDLPTPVSVSRTESEKILRDLIAANPTRSDYPIKIISQHPDVVMIDCRKITADQTSAQKR